MSEPIPEGFYDTEFVSATLALSDEQSQIWVMSLNTRNGQLIIDGRQITVTGYLDGSICPPDVWDWDDEDSEWRVIDE